MGLDATVAFQTQVSPPRRLLLLFSPRPRSSFSDGFLTPWYEDRFYLWRCAERNERGVGGGKKRDEFSSRGCLVRIVTSPRPYVHSFSFQRAASHLGRKRGRKGGLFGWFSITLWAWESPPPLIVCLYETPSRLKTCFRSLLAAYSKSFSYLDILRLCSGLWFYLGLGLRFRLQCLFNTKYYKHFPTHWLFTLLLGWIVTVWCSGLEITWEDIVLPTCLLF